MNSIIKKCIDELAKQDFRKDYVLGMLETLYEMENTPMAANTPQSTYPMPQINPQIKSDVPQMPMPDLGFIDELRKSGQIRTE